MATLAHGEAPGLATLATDAFNLSPLGQLGDIKTLVLDAAGVINRMLNNLGAWVITTPYLGASSAYADHKHHGVDIAGKLGTLIYAPDAGTIVAGPSGYDGPNTLGTGVYERLDSGELLVFGHTMRGPAVPLGTRVVAGQHIGELGSSGNSSGPHIHFQVLPKGITNPLQDINPLTWLVARLNGTSAPAITVPAPGPSTTPGSTTPGTSPGTTTPPAPAIGSVPGSVPADVPGSVPTSGSVTAAADWSKVTLAELGPWKVTVDAGWWLRVALTLIAIVLIVYGLMRLAGVDEMVVGGVKTGAKLATKAATGGVL